MTDFKTSNKVVQDNALIRSLGMLDSITIKIFEIFVSAIDPVNPPINNTVYLSKNDLHFMFQDDKQTHYTRFNHYLKRVQKQVIEIKKGEKVILIVPVTTIEYGTKDSDNLIRVVFNQEIMPYLVNLRKNYTQFPVSDLYGIRKKYSLILFQFCYSQFNIRKKDNFETVIFDVDLTTLREITGTNKLFLNFSNFEARVLKDSINEINASFSTLQVNYLKVKQGRKITHIRFVINKLDNEAHILAMERWHKLATAAR